MTPGAPPATVRPWTRRIRHGWILEAALGVGLYILFDDLRSRVAGSGTAALAHAQDVVALERATGLYQEHRIQQAFIDWHGVLSFGNLYYGTVHFVMPVVALVVLWRRAPARYVLWRNTLLLMLGTALLLFWTYPLMPPRLMPPHYGFVDTAAQFFNFGPQQPVHLHHEVPDAASQAAFGNLFAAMPSLHAGWSAWSALALLPALRSRALKVLVLVDPVLTTFAIVVTANHWILDAIVGWALLALCWGTVTAYERWRHPADAARASGAAVRAALAPA